MEYLFRANRNKRPRTENPPQYSRRPPTTFTVSAALTAFSGDPHSGGVLRRISHTRVAGVLATPTEKVAKVFRAPGAHACLDTGTKSGGRNTYLPPSSNKYHSPQGGEESPFGFRKQRNTPW
ncbi:uncharacterized protein G2W53_001184 [Senna tora]|uniref:Uncharacterized protein n=1 Tax=Senna tora TaxID=362788 RepID=A0A834XH58_9FABA|nr:uncharacterized protein G2W53_001184 [Senna tora]